MNRQFTSLLKFISLMLLAIAGQLIMVSASEKSTDYYSLATLIATILVFTLFGAVLGGNDLGQYLSSRLRVRTSFFKLSLGLAGLTIFLTVGILALFEPGNNFAPNGVFEFFLKSPVFTPLYLITCGYFLAWSVEKYDGMF
ncbi:hypothetical protein ACHAL6_12405 [Proteiniclasticum sp. C24MP]|uniref:hypothetical protein n=1 Tax=Proteiniclasticum sp. C24MP TaxID=3374101 RepID=UPI00375400C0